MNQNVHIGHEQTSARTAPLVLDLLKIYCRCRLFILGNMVSLRAHVFKNSQVLDALVYAKLRGEKAAETPREPKV